MAMTAQEATVQVLSAEVRVLMVGSRQVTLSVYRQLDSVDFSDFEPFGRVNARESSSRKLDFVGRAGGRLVSATLFHPSGGSWSGPNAFQHWWQHVSGEQLLKTGLLPHLNVQAPSRVVVAEEDTTSVIWDVNMPLRYFPIDGVPFYEPECTYGDPHDAGLLEEAWQSEANDQLIDCLRIRRHWELAKKLPLIVLAGLR